nr:class D beta-lactamase [Methylomonas lenta]
MLSSDAICAPPVVGTPYGSSFAPHNLVVMLNKFFIIFLLTIFSACVSAEDKDFAKLFEQQGVEGTIVISSLDGEYTFIHNESRAKQSQAIASTFKIMNTLISLEEKAILGKNDVFKWDGHIYDLPVWNHDQTLESAFKVSCVWCYQELARRVGKKKYQYYFNKSGYGHLQEPFNLTTFWLDGSLEISALEQVAFLKKVYLRSLPFSEFSYDTLKEIMMVDQTATYTIYAKTGWASRAKPQVGWYVGYLETPKNVWFFATNIETRNEKDLPLRITLTRQALQAKGIIE